MLVEAGLELVPPQIASHPAVKRNAERRGKKPLETLLDISVHKPAMAKLPKWYKRGRPDIAHGFLLLAQGSILNIEGLLRVHLYTFSGLYIEVDPSLRPPRDYRRFIGLMEQLLKVGRVPPDRPLMKVREEALKSVQRRIRPDVTVLLSEKGQPVKLREFGRMVLQHGTPLIMIGGFQRGDFEEETRSIADLTLSIYPKPLDTLTVTSRVLCSLESELLKW